MISDVNKVMCFSTIGCLCRYIMWHDRLYCDMTMASVTSHTYIRCHSTYSDEKLMFHQCVRTSLYPHSHTQCLQSKQRMEKYKSAQYVCVCLLHKKQITRREGEDIVQYWSWARTKANDVIMAAANLMFLLDTQHYFPGIHENIIKSFPRWRHCSYFKAITRACSCVSIQILYY